MGFTQFCNVGMATYYFVGRNEYYYSDDEKAEESMRLYLSSVGIPDTAAYLKLFVKNQPRTVAIIPTAWSVAPQEAGPFIQQLTKQFEDLGFRHEILKLEDYANKSANLHKKLSQFSAIWVTGGNSFYLNYWMQASGFDKILPDLLKNGLIYGGESAGAVVAGRILHGIELLDDPNDAPEVIWPGLGLVDYGIIPHWGDKYAGRIEQTYEEMRLFGAVKTLANHQFITTS